MSTATTPSPFLGAVMHATRAYSKLFSESRFAPILSRPAPVRHSDYDRVLRVETRTVEADGVVSLTLVSPDGGVLPSWVPGAHVDVFLASGLQRQYSLCGDPADRTRYRIAVRRVDDGVGSAEIHETIAEHSTIRVRGPRNAFPLAEAPSYLFVAAGIGITPILPMIRSVAGAGRPWKLYYLGRSLDTMPFRNELSALPGGDVMIRPDDEFGITPIAEILDHAQPHGAIYLCGPAPLAKDAHQQAPLVAPTCSLHTERFSPPPVVGGEPFEMRLARTGSTVQVAADETTLSAIRRAVPGATYSCRQGFCGTCKVRVLSGDVDHRDTRLLGEQRAESMLPCVSRAAGSALEIDL
ncbi:oxidoreductase [Rhodococcus sp. HNM0563]|uniref:PDR/VanB family oxidoreductase n=1 Tax=unclassified Rhodococcus (in: high G+C Gram-positive bacteria) TaxID=192944 RepID=UPI00146E7ECA|nr:MULTISPECIES: PDR/VanB family oxidoreductase [unclassified Rhodococcus (in: high G+C Gram-positive bacteria)]MCK0091776.1 PDR/VanB family oxidoreductase [Rhodococcus sp. F64268]NLU64114.1 oxidoreductase [Rhodococcus sp. HNM0563]